MVGRVDASAPIGARMDTAGELQGINLAGAGSSVPAGYRSTAPVIELRAAPAAGSRSLTDADPTREGLQTPDMQLQMRPFSMISKSGMYRAEPAPAVTASCTLLRPHSTG